MGFWTKLKGSFFSPQQYRDVSQGRLSSAFGYYFAIVALISLTVSGVFSFIAVPAVQEFANVTVSQVIASIPQNLSLRIKDDLASTNDPAAEPIFFQSSDTDPSKQVTFVVLDTTRKFSYEQFKAFNAIVWIANDGVGTFKDGSSGQIQFMPYKGVKDLTITGAMVADLVAQARTYLPVLYAFFVPVLFLLSFMYHVGTLIWLLLGALLVLLIAKGRGIALTYKQAYAISLYAVTASLLFRLFEVFIFATSIPFGFTMVFIVVVVLNLDPMLFVAKKEEGLQPVQ